MQHPSQRGGFGLVEVARVDHCHVRNSLDESDVLHNLMGRPVLTGGDAGVRTAYLHIVVGVGHHHAYLVQHACGAEVSK